jgi:hypothetical protein
MKGREKGEKGEKGEKRKKREVGKRFEEREKKRKREKEKMMWKMDIESLRIERIGKVEVETGVQTSVEMGKDPKRLKKSAGMNDDVTFCEFKRQNFKNLPRYR